jgi:aldehyde dehydrogenase (NAD+)
LTPCNEVQLTQSPIETRLSIANQMTPGEGGLIEVTNPATEELVARFAGASAGQVDAAVEAARAAFDDGRWRDPQLRKSTIMAFASLVEAHRDPLMDLLISEVGTPVSLKANHIDTPVAFMRWFAEQGTQDYTRQLGLNPAATGCSMVAYRPVGVVAAISAFNYPLLIGLTKVASALAVGCTAVLLSSPLAPLTILAVGDLARRAGFPPGVLNFLAGGADTGLALTSHPKVDKITFTGSVNVGRQVMKQAAEGLRGVVLELGGKSAAIMLPGVDLAKYAYSLHARYARNAGQGCGSPTRILIEESRADEFAGLSRAAYEKIQVGDPRDPRTVVGPVITRQQRDRIEQGVANAVAAGARIMAGGGRPDMAKGWFLNPVLVGGLNNGAAIARNELFGPVSVVLTYRTVADAVRIANDSELGLKAYIFGDRRECLRLAPELRVGTVQINGGTPLRPDAPMNGYKHSGLGAEWGEDGLREFLCPQHIDVALD